jgi:hypothetical protein
MGRYITSTGTASPVIREVNANYQAVVNDRILVNSTSAAFTVTLPLAASLIQGDTIQIIDVGNNLTTNSVTVSRNGALILGVADDLTLDVNGSIATLLYTGGTYGWVLTSA